MAGRRAWAPVAGDRAPGRGLRRGQSRQRVSATAPDRIAPVRDGGQRPQPEVDGLRRQRERVAVHALGLGAGAHLFNYADTPDFSMQELVDTRRASGDRRSTGLGCRTRQATS